MEYTKAAIARYVGVTAVGIAVLAAGAAYGTRGGTASNNYVDCQTTYVACTATGGLAKYPFCNWTEPVTDAGSGSQIQSLFLSVGPMPNTIGFDGTIGPSTTVSGALAIKNFTDWRTVSGSNVLFSSGSLKVNSGSTLRIVTLQDPGAGARATLEIEYCTLLTKR